MIRRTLVLFVLLVASAAVAQSAGQNAAPGRGPEAGEAAKKAPGEPSSAGAEPAAPLLARGMTLEQVERLLGKPESQAGGKVGDREVVVRRFKDGTEVRFVNGAVESWVLRQPKSPAAGNAGGGALSSSGKAASSVRKGSSFRGGTRGAESAYVADLNGDGKMDLLLADGYSRILWYENLGGGSSWREHVITESGDGVWGVYAADLDGDGKLDILAGSNGNIAWYKNLGGGVFGPEQVISDCVSSAHVVLATDLRGYGKADVISVSVGDNKVAWYENLGDGHFGPQSVITTSLKYPYSLCAADLDGDGRTDVVSAGLFGRKIAWFKNLGGGGFGPEQVVATSEPLAAPPLLPSPFTFLPVSIFATDLDGDGLVDLLAGWGVVVWYKNLGAGRFGPGQVIAGPGEFGSYVYAKDVDGDGLPDVLTTTDLPGGIAWYKNLGGGRFGQRRMIANLEGTVLWACAADLDGDGLADVLAGSIGLVEGKVVWFKNLGSGKFGPERLITTLR